MKRICVYCASNPGRNPAFHDSCDQLAEALVEQGLGLIYGGASVGIMGRIADKVLAAGGEVIGVMPQVLVEKELAHPGLTELRLVSSMHARKALMADLADGFIALPGGLGTLEELFETWTWSVLGIHNKPCGLLNSGNYYDLLLQFLEHAKEEQLIRAHHHKLLLCAEDPGQLLEKMQAFRCEALKNGLSRQQR